MNSRFLRNGLVTLVLVVGTAALLYMFIFQPSTSQAIAYSGSGNTFEHPDVIVPQNHAVSVDRGRLTLELPAMSIATVTARLS